MMDWWWTAPVMDMRPSIRCPACGRKGAAPRISNTRVAIEHRCPGPWTLASVEQVPGASYGTNRYTIFPKDDEGRAKVNAAWPEMRS